MAAKRKNKKKDVENSLTQEKKSETLIEKYQKNLALYRDMDYKEGEAECHILLAVEYLKANNLLKAEFHLTKGIEIYQTLESVEELASAFELLGDVKAKAGAVGAFEAYIEAEKYFEEMENIEKKREVEIKIANFFFQKGDYKEALKHFLKAQKIEESKGLILSIGKCHQLLGEIDKALNLYLENLDEFSEKERSEALVRIGDLYLEHKKRDKLAEEYYKKAEEIKGFENQARAQFRLGRYYFEKRDYEKAEMYLKRALENTKKTGDKEKPNKITHLLCELYLKIGQEEKALVHYKNMLKTLPEKEKPEILSKMIEIQRKLGQEEEVVRLLRERIEIHKKLEQTPDLLESYKLLEEIYEKKGGEKADLKLLELYKETANTAKELENRNLEAEYNSKIEKYYIKKGKLNKQKSFYKEMESYYYNLGEPKAALLFFEKSWLLHKEKGLEEFQARDALNLGKFFMSEALYQEAESWFKKAEKIFSNLKKKQMAGVVRTYLGTIKKNLGEYDMAVEHYKKAKKLFKSAGDKISQVKVNAYLETIYDLKARKIHNERAKVLEEINKLNTKIKSFEAKNSALKEKIKNINSLLEETQRNTGEIKKTVEKIREDIKRTSSEKKKKKLSSQLLSFERRVEKNRETRIRLKSELREAEDEIASNDYKIRILKEEMKKREEVSKELKKRIQEEEERALKYHQMGREENPLLASLTKLEAIETEIYSHLAEGRVPAMVFPTRSKSNIEFNERERVFKLGSFTTHRSAKTVAGANMLLKTSYVIDFIRSMIDSTFKGKPRSSTLRELYYISEGWGKLAKFESQDSSNQVIEDLEVATKWMREHFKLRPEEDGARVIGDITIRERNRKGKWKTINCKEDVGDSGYTIPYNVEKDKMEFKKVKADFVLAIETGGMFDRLVENGFDEAYNCILVHIKGQPARSTRRFIKRLNQELNLPVYCFTDGDPWSYRIYASIAYGAIKTAHISDYLATPSAEFIGITPEDIVNYNLPTDKLSAQDISALKAELTDPRFKDPFWQEQIKLQLKIGKKSEQQALAKYGLDFVTDTYLPDKLSEMETDLVF